MNHLENGLQTLGLDKYYEHPFVQKCCKLSKQTPQIVMAVFVLVLLVLVLSPVGFVITSAFTFLYPAYRTFKALESKGVEDDQKMLTFWVCYGFLYLFDSYLSYFLSFLYFYHVFRAMLIIYLFQSGYSGSRLVYTKVIQPLFEKYQEKINMFLDPLELHSKNLLGEKKNEQQIDKIIIFQKYTLLIE